MQINQWRSNVQSTWPVSATSRGIKHGSCFFLHFLLLFLQLAFFSESPGTTPEQGPKVDTASFSPTWFSDLVCSRSRFRRFLEVGQRSPSYFSTENRVRTCDRLLCLLFLVSCRPCLRLLSSSFARRRPTRTLSGGRLPHLLPSYFSFGRLPVSFFATISQGSFF